MKILEKYLISNSIFIIFISITNENAYAQVDGPNAFTLFYLGISMISCVVPMIIGGICTAWIYADGKKRMLFRKDYWYLCLVLGIIGMFLSPIPIISIVGVIIWYLVREQAQQPEFIMSYPPYYPPYGDPYMQYGYPQYMQYPYPPPPPPPDYKENDKNTKQGIEPNSQTKTVGPKQACKNCYRPYDPKNETCITCTKV
ncbi:MAG: hypothetical protein QXT63_05355 [Thermoplasmata archaeon]